MAALRGVDKPSFTHIKTLKVDLALHSVYKTSLSDIKTLKVNALGTEI